MPLLLVVVFVIVPIVEIYVIIQVGQAIGPLWTIALLVADSILGSWLLRREGARTWQAFRRGLQSGRPPAREVADGALVITGGALMLSPGFVTDALGLLCILPPTRAVLRRVLTGMVTRRLLGPLAGGSSRRIRPDARSAGHPPSGGSDRVVEGEIVDR